ncbi:hypothetical protein [Arenimonas sp. GDDSR-1]|uniref:hypothetical protein n=1 Tax=Arenimonas sp. GDDSR-1 TaxID=2950125 RepID=UPI00262976B9|nr:hypothetical protein [Arenimonas sp. GDDSR-1]
MAEHTAEIRWAASPHPGQPDTFSRDHTVRLENGHELLNSSAPAYFGNPAAANPETLLLASWRNMPIAPSAFSAKTPTAAWRLPIAP